MDPDIDADIICLLAAEQLSACEGAISGADLGMNLELWLARSQLRDCKRAFFTEEDGYESGISAK